MRRWSLRRRPSVTVQLITITLTFKQQVSPWQPMKALPLALHPPINSIGIKEQIKHDGEEEPTLLPGVFLSLFFFPEQVILKIKPCEKNCRAHVTAVRRGGSKPGIRQAHLVFFHIFVFVDKLSSRALKCTKKKNSRGGIAEETHGKMSSEIKRTMAFYDLKPSPSNA